MHCLLQQPLKYLALLFSYKVHYGDNGLEGYAQTTLNGMSVMATVVDGVFYLDIAGAKIYASLDKIDE